MSYILNICMCGAEAGYPHDPCCPYPLYRGTLADEEAWEEAYADRCDAEYLDAVLPKKEQD